MERRKKKGVTEVVVHETLHGQEGIEFVYLYITMIGFHFSETFGVGKVGLLTGDSAVNKDAQVIIMTTEILRNMMYRRQVKLIFLFTSTF